MNDPTQSESPPIELPQSERLARVAEALARQELGLLPRRVWVTIHTEALTIWLDGALTPAETELARTAEGREFVRRYNQQLVSGIRPEIIRVMESVLQRRISDFESDVNASRGHVLWYFVLGSAEEKQP